MGWPRMVEWHDRGRDVAADPTPLVGTGTRVCTIGGCTALDLAAGLEAAGLNGRVHPTGYFHTPVTVRQEIARSLGEATSRSRERCWRTASGLVHPDHDYRGRTFATEAEVLAWSGEFDRCADELFRQSDVVVVTLGNAEAWRDRETGHHLPEMPPPEVHDPSRHECVRLSVAEIEAELTALHRLVTDRLGARLVLAVTPVPLSETFWEADARAGTLAGKALIRAAIVEFARHVPGVPYFPAMEIVFGADRPSDFMLEDGRHLSRAARDYLVWRFVRQFGDGDVGVPEPDTSWFTGPTKTARDYRRDGVRRLPESWLAWPRERDR
jgi:hypothetical protein